MPTTLRVTRPAQERSLPAQAPKTPQEPLWPSRLQAPLSARAQAQAAPGIPQPAQKSRSPRSSPQGRSRRREACRRNRLPEPKRALAAEKEPPPKEVSSTSLRTKEKRWMPGQAWGLREARQAELQPLVQMLEPMPELLEREQKPLAQA